MYINIHTSNPALYCTEHLHAVQSVQLLCCNHFNSVINSCFLFFSRSLGKTAASQICRLWSSTKTTRPKLTERGQTHRWVNPQLTHTSCDWLNDLNDVCCVRYQIWSRGWLTALRRWRVCNSNLKTVNRMQKSWSVKVSKHPNSWLSFGLFVTGCFCWNVAPFCQISVLTIGTLALDKEKNLRGLFEKQKQMAYQEAQRLFNSF